MAKHQVNQLGSRQPAEHFSDRLTAGFHRAIGHQQMDGRVGIPDIEVRIERAKFGPIITDSARREPSQPRTAVGCFLHPAPYAVTH